MRLKWVLILLLVAAVIGLISWAAKGLECRRVFREQTTLSANNIAQSIALFSTRQVISRDWNALQRYSESLVRSRPFVYIAIVDTQGRAVIHTDASRRGREFRQSGYGRNVVHAFEPVMSGSRQIGTVRVGLRTVQTQ